MTSLAGRSAVITGSSSGVGAACARALHGAGVRLGLLSRRGDDLALDGVVARACDVGDREAVFSAVADVAAAHGGIDIVIANAGVGMYGSFLELAPEHLDEMIDTNLKGTLYTAAATLPHLVKSDAADFISLASVAGLRAFEGEAVYNASKFGQVGFTRALDLEFNARGVRCTSIAPGGVNTEFAMGTGREHGDPQVEAMMSADDVAEVVLFTLTRPRTMRMLTTSFRPMNEGSAG